jgi:hypothetical protein
MHHVRPLHLEVIAPTYQGLGLCSVCELFLASAEISDQAARRTLAEYPPEWQAEFQRLADWVNELAEQYGDSIRITVIDPQSPEGLFVSIRHWVRHYPTWILNGKKCVVGWDRTALEAALSRSREV